MDIMELGAIGELVGGVAVIATLLYLALQIRRSSIAENARAFESATNAWNLAAANLLEDTNLATFQLGCSEYHTLPTGERFRFTLLVVQFLDRFDMMLHFEAPGIIESGYVSGYYGTLIHDFMQNPGFQAVWREEGNYFSPRLRRWMREHCSAAGDPHEVGALVHVGRDS